MIVRVAGLGKAFSIDLEDVFVNAEVMYQTMHSACLASAIYETLAAGTHNQLVRYGSFERFRQLLRVLAHTSLPCPYSVQRIADTTSVSVCVYTTRPCIA